MFSYLLSTALLPLALGAITPTSPDSNTVVKVGDQITALWTADTTGSWKNVEIQLMTGDNFNMIPLSTLATGLDGTSTTTFSAAAPDVSPNAKIYFLQFTEGGDVTTATWTTRFTIAAADGTTSEPTNTTNYSGTDVQWGTGVLLGDGTTNSTTSSTSASSAPSSTSTGMTIYAVSSTSASTDAASTSASDAASSMISAAASASGSTAASASTSKSSTGAGFRGVEVSMGLGMGVASLVGLASLLL